MSRAPRLPSTIQVFERGWLSANNILLADGECATLIDSGYLSHVAQTLQLLRAGLDGRRLVQLINTHSHSDHIGGNAAVQRMSGCEIVVPAGMAAMVERWDEAGLLLSVADQLGERFAVDATMAAGERFVAGELEWQAIAVPGHDHDALAYYNAERRVLISGDALWRDGFGILFPEVLGEGDGIAGARRALEAIGGLAVDVVIPGHGAPFADFDEAMERALARLRAFEEDGARLARNAIRACFTFTLLDLRSFALERLPEYLATTPLHRDANARFLGLQPDALAQWLVAELERAGVAERQGELLVAR